MKKDILSMNPDELASLMEQLNVPSYRSAQIFDWLHRRNASSFSEMDNLPKSLRVTLDDQCRITSCQPVSTLISSQDGTHKFLFALEDDMLIETVRIEYSFGQSICISTQAGCRMGCRFCASTESGLVRNLTAGEMCAQIYNSSDNRPSGIVLMGCGEPLDNLKETIRFLELIGHPKGAAIGARHITISTCGLIPQMIELADLCLQINLAVSLHAPNDLIRKEIMPITNRYPIRDLIDACKYYISKTNRRITFEYALIRGLNDSSEHAAALIKLLTGMLCHVNLIPVNPRSEKSTEKNPYHPTLRKEAEVFRDILQRGHIPATIRRTIGSDVNAACGQLRSSIGKSSHLSNHSSVTG